MADNSGTQTEVESAAEQTQKNMELTTVLLVAGTLFLVYQYGKFRFSHFKRLGVKGPSPWPFIGNLMQFAAKGSARIVMEWKEKYGDVYGIYAGYKPLLMISDLEILRSIQVKEFNNFMDRWTLDVNPPPVDKGVFFQSGENWKRVRNIVTPTFSGGKLRLMCRQINQCARQLRKNFLQAAHEKKAIIPDRMFSAFTMDVIALTAFGLEVDSQNNPQDPFVHNAKKIFEQNILVSPAMMLIFMFPSLNKFLKPSAFPRNSIKFFSDVTKETIELRKNKKQQSVDFLQLLLDAESNESDQTGRDVPEVKTKRLTTEEIIGQAFLFFIAGYETTANTLNYISHALCFNPDIQEKMLEEIREALGDDDPDYDNIKKLKYMDQVVEEALRKYPPVPVLNRDVAETIHINGVTIEKDMAIGIPVYAIHHDPKNYSNPEVFDPDRFSPEAKAKLHPMAFQPFGQGPRMCVGMRLALIEAKIALAHVIKSVKFVTCSETQENLTFVDRGGIMKTEKPITMKVEAR